MFKIAKSMFAIVAVAAIAAGSTSAYFSDTATITGNTFSTGKLEIRVDGMQTIHGMHFTNAYPSDVDNAGTYVVTDALILGGSTLNAKTLLLNVANVTGDSNLLAATKIQIEVRKNWGLTGPWVPAYNGSVGALSNVDLIHAPLDLSDLAPAEGIGLRYKIWVPDTGVNQNELMQKTMTWDFAIEGRTS